MAVTSVCGGESEKPYPSVPADWKMVNRWLFANPRVTQVVLHDMMRSRWPGVEQYVLTDAAVAVRFAEEFIGGRFPEAEETIATDACEAVRYATYVIEGRWPEAENTIATVAHAAVLYSRDVIKGRWPEAEKTITSNARAASEYFNVFGEQFDDAAAALCPYWAYRFAKDIVRGKLPPKLHQKMQMWALSSEYRGNKYVKLYLSSKKYQ